MSQDQLVALATLSIEHDIAEFIDINEIILSLSELKVRKMGSIL